MISGDYSFELKSDQVGPNCETRLVSGRIQLLAYTYWPSSLRLSWYHLSLNQLSRRSISLSCVPRDAVRHHKCKLNVYRLNPYVHELTSLLTKRSHLILCQAPLESMSKCLIACSRPHQLLVLKLGLKWEKYSSILGHTRQHWDIIFDGFPCSIAVGAVRSSDVNAVELVVKFSLLVFQPLAPFSVQR